MDFIERMQRRGLSVSELAALTKVGPATIYRARRGIAPGQVILDALGRGLGVTGSTVKKSIAVTKVAAA